VSNEPNAYKDLVPVDLRGICIIFISGKQLESDPVTNVLMYSYTPVYDMLHSFLTFISVNLTSKISRRPLMRLPGSILRRPIRRTGLMLISLLL
jgi:hypothetical protein